MAEQRSGDTPPQYPIESVDNALRLLKMFRDQRQIRLSDAREELGVAHSTAHRLMAMLVYHGFATQDPAARAYFAGPALVDIGLATIRTMDIRAAARATLESLSAATNETAHLAQLEGQNVRFLDGVEGDRALRVASRTGRLLPAHATSVGKALLAQLDTDTLLALYPEELLPQGPTAKSLATRSDLLTELERVRRRGYAQNAGESEDGVSSIGVAIVHPARGVVAALSVAAPVGRMSPAQVKTVTRQLQEAVSALQDELV